MRSTCPHEERDFNGLARRMSRFVVGVLRLLFLLVLGCEAPRRVIFVGFGATFWTRLYYHLSRALQGARFFEAPMPSLFHAVLPDETCLTRGVYRCDVLKKCHGASPGRWRR
jgi:hypothetical protein